jgi:hypothetical protein
MIPGGIGCVARQQTKAQFGNRTNLAFFTGVIAC